MRLKSVLRTSVAACVLFLPVSAHAQQGSGDDDVIVITASRLPIAVGEATSSISLLNEADLEARGAVFVADALRAVPGLAVSKSGPAGSLTQIRARGSEANHVLILIDGIEVSSPFTGETDFGQMVFDDLASIEVARGEQSALWGADAIGGVMHLTSRTPEDGFESHFRLEAGSFGTHRASARLATGFDGGHLSLSLSDLESDGIDISGLGGEEDSYSNRSAAVSGAYDLTDALRFDASIRWIDHEAQSDADSNWDGRLDDTDNTRKGEQVFAHIGLATDYKSGAVDWFHQAGVQLTDDASSSFASGLRTARSLGQRLQGTYQASAVWTAGESDHRLTGLVEIERDRSKNDGGPGSLANQTRSVETLTFALDYGFERGPLGLTASARHEQNDSFDDAETWRVGASWDVDALDGRIRLSGGEGVKNPGVFELFGYFPAFFIGNPDLNPERSRGWELGWEQDIAQGQGQWSAVWFSSKLDDEIYTDFASFPATARNRTSQSTREGLELEGRWAFSDDVSAFASATFLTSEENGVAEIRRPERLASMTLDWRPEGQAWSASMTLDHTGEQIDTDFATFQPVMLDAYTLLGGQLRWQIRDNVDVYVRGENLLDEDYQDVFGFNTPGRGLYFGLRLRNG